MTLSSHSTKAPASTNTARVMPTTSPEIADLAGLLSRESA
jgi:hypothetical protein